MFQLTAFIGGPNVATLELKWLLARENEMGMVTGVEALYPLILDSISDGVFTVDAGFNVTSFNAAAERIIGISRERAIGSKCHEVFKASVCQTGCVLRRTLRTGVPRRDVRIDVLNAQMAVVPIAVSTAVLNDRAGQMIGGIEVFRDLTDVENLRTELEGRHRFRDMIGKSPAMREIFSLAPQVAGADVPVLIHGPSGTGKELLAQAIHDLSARRNAPFVRVNCGALPDTLLESELFGYFKGAFTGAVHNKPGRFSQADGGTLFLDEIGDVSPAFQVKLLRVLEEGEIQPLGATKTIRVNVRLVSATNRNLATMVREGRFREDLFYRVNVVPVALPRLADRREDIPLLIDHFAKQLAARTSRRPPRIEAAALEMLYDYDYPGNVRELRNLLERAFVLCDTDVIAARHLPPELVASSAGRGDGPGVARQPSAVDNHAASQLTPNGDQTMSAETVELLEVLQAHGWNRTRAAKALNIGRTTLWRRMKAHGLI